MNFSGTEIMTKVAPTVNRRPLTLTQYVTKNGGGRCVGCPQAASVREAAGSLTMVCTAKAYDRGTPGQNNPPRVKVDGAYYISCVRACKACPRTGSRVASYG